MRGMTLRLALVAILAAGSGCAGLRDFLAEDVPAAAAETVAEVSSDPTSIGPGIVGGVLSVASIFAGKLLARGLKRASRGLTRGAVEELAQEEADPSSPSRPLTDALRKATEAATRTREVRE